MVSFVRESFSYSNLGRFEVGKKEKVPCKHALPIFRNILNNERNRYSEGGVSHYRSTDVVSHVEGCDSCRRKIKNVIDKRAKDGGETTYEGTVEETITKARNNARYL